MQEEDTLDKAIHDFGMCTDVVDIIFDEELFDSADENDQQTIQEALANMPQNSTQRQRQDIYENLLQLSTNSTLQRNTTTLIVVKYNVHVCTIQRVCVLHKLSTMAFSSPAYVLSFTPPFHGEGHRTNNG